MVSFELQLVKFACVSQRFQNVLLNFTEPNLDTLIFVQGLDLELDSEKVRNRGEFESLQIQNKTLFKIAIGIGYCLKLLDERLVKL